EEHVDRERERRVGIGVDHRGEAGPHCEPVNEAAHRERKHVEVEALPERSFWTANRPASLRDRAAEGGEPGSNTRGERADPSERRTDRERDEPPDEADRPRA